MSKTKATQHPRRTPLQFVEQHFQQRTIAGLMEIVPLLVTVAVTALLIRHADRFIRPLPGIADQPWDVPGIGVLAIVAALYIIGLINATPPGRWLMILKNNVMTRIPVIRFLYSATRQATTALTQEYRFSRVVFLEWPRDGTIAMGFVTARAYHDRRRHSVAVVYIPTVPNPTNGHMVFINEDDLFESDLSVEDALKLILSGGIVMPESMAFARIPRDPEENEFNGRFSVTPR